jgi:hypothetical protein
VLLPKFKPIDSTTSESRDVFNKGTPNLYFTTLIAGFSMKFTFGFIAGIVVTGLLIDRGVNLPDRLGRLINGGEVRQLGRDIGHAVKKP